MAQLFALGRPHQSLLYLSFVCMAVVGLTTGAYAWLLGPALRFLLSGGATPLPAATRWLQQLIPDPRLGLPLLLVALGAVKGLGYLGQFFFVGWYGQKVVVDLRRKVMRRLLSLSPLQLSQRLSGDLLARFTADVAAVEQAATYTVASWLRDSLQIAVLVAVAVALSWKLALVALLAVPLAVWPASRLTRALLNRVRQAQAQVGVLAGQLQEGVGAVRTLQAFGAERAESARFGERAATLRHALSRAAWSRAAVPGVMELMAGLAIALALGVALGTSAVGPEQLVSFLATLLLVYQPAKDLGRVSQFGLQAAAALERLDALLSLPESVPVRAGLPPAPPLAEALRFEGVSFAWGGREALRGVELTLPAGKTTALVGESGSGKSTLAALLMRFEDPTAGRVTLDGIDLRALELTSLRQRFALVTQEPLLLSASVADNLRLGAPAATDAELEAAARAAQAWDFIQALPEKLGTPLGERGVKLSGGQRQRLCLARALLSQAQVLVLDEATSSLDPEGEREVQAALDQLLAQPGRTAVVIAHRLRTIAKADRIVVLEQGRVLEQGTHAELLERRGRYHALWEAQSLAGAA